MILVTVGTNEAPFDRLIQAADGFVLDEPLVVQYGSSRIRPRRAECLDFVPFDRLVDLVRSARVVVTHAGVGSVLVAITNGKRPVVVPRLRRYHEAVDDHQLPFARRLETAGLATLVEEPAELSKALSDFEQKAAPELSLGGHHALALELRAYLSERLVAAPRRAHWAR